MLGIAELDTLLSLESSEEQLLLSLAALQLENLNPELISLAIEKTSLTADLHPDLQIELHEIRKIAVDCSGTGGSGVAHFNTSTCVAFVLAAAGFKIVKFGGRAASGKSGSFDFLEGLGIACDLPPQRISDAVTVCGVAFVYAPRIYPGLARLVPLRKSFGKATVFNYIGPLLNPVRPAARLMGISSDPARKMIAAHLIKDKKCKDALLATAGGFLDEIAIDMGTSISMIQDGQIKEFEVDPLEFPFFNMSSLHLASSEIIEHNTRDNLRIFQSILDGDDSSSASYKMILLNSAAALFMLKACKSILEGIELAEELFVSGAVAETISTSRRFYEQLSR